MKTIALIPLLLFFLSCTADEIQMSINLERYDSYEFGFQAEGGATFFTIFQEHLYRRDSTSRNYNFNVAEPVGQYEIAKEVLVDLPQDFFTNDQSTYGCPNCADQGMIIIRWKRDGHKSTLIWSLDPDDHSHTEVVDYTQKVRDIIKSLK